MGFPLARHAYLQPLRFRLGLVARVCLNMSFAWEAPEFPWEAPRVASSSDVGGHELGESELSRQEAGLELFNYIVHLKTSNLIAAKHACILSWWAWKSGVAGPVKDLAMSPETTQSGHFSRHYDLVSRCKPSEAEDWYKLPVPLTLRADGARKICETETLVPHEVLLEEVWSDNTLPAKLEAAKTDGTLPQSYTQHAAVKGEPSRPVYPLYFYVDGVAFARHDSVVGFYLYNGLTGVRHLCAALRKSELCKCGCRGWCSLWAVLSFLSWSIGCLFRGRFPERRHDGSPFRDGEDDSRVVLAGRDMGCRAALIGIKADWAEFSSTLGFPTWSSRSDPCLFCKAVSETLFSVGGLSPMQTPCPAKTFEDYCAACARCELRRTLGPHQFAEVRAALDFDKRRGGNQGRALRVDVPSCGLLRGDRLEPSVFTPDIGEAFDRMVPPVHVVFWRRSEETLTKHRNPLFTEEYGVTPQSCIQVDWMHTMSLGVFGDFVAKLLQQLVANNAWAVQGSPDVRRQLSFQRLEHELFQWYKAEAARGVFHSRVQRLEPSMMGKPDAPACNLHAGETNGFVAFSEVLVQRYGHVLADRRVWQETAAQVQRVKELCDMVPQMFKQCHSQDIEANLQETPVSKRRAATSLHRVVTACIQEFRICQTNCGVSRTPPTDIHVNICGSMRWAN